MVGHQLCKAQAIRSRDFTFLRLHTLTRAIPERLIQGDTPMLPKLIIRCMHAPHATKESRSAISAWFTACGPIALCTRSWATAVTAVELKVLFRFSSVLVI